MTASFAVAAFDKFSKSTCLPSSLIEEGCCGSPSIVKTGISLAVATTAAPIGVLWNAGAICVYYIAWLIEGCVSGQNWEKIDQCTAAFFTDLSISFWGILALSATIFSATVIIEGQTLLGLIFLFTVQYLYANGLPNPDRSSQNIRAEVERQQRAEYWRQHEAERIRQAQEDFRHFQERYSSAALSPRLTELQVWNALLTKAEEALSRHVMDRTAEYIQYRQRIFNRASPHALLELGEQYDETALKRAYRHAAMVLHPDKNRGWELEAGEIFKCIVIANQSLQDKLSRR